MKSLQGTRTHFRYKITQQGLDALRAVDPIGKNIPQDGGFAVIDGKSGAVAGNVHPPA